jgi:hypothetical protein
VRFDVRLVQRPGVDDRIYTKLANRQVHEFAIGHRADDLRVIRGYWVRAYYLVALAGQPRHHRLA